MTNPLYELEELGQSVWLDDINREDLRSGLFARLITEDSLTGAAGNPTIFEHAIDHGCVRLSVKEHVSAAHPCLDYDQLTRQLQEDGDAALRGVLPNVVRSH